VPDSAEILDQAFFSGCSALVDIMIQPSSSLKTIGNSAFSGCVSLTTIFIPKTVAIICGDAFAPSGVRRIRIDSANQFFVFQKRGLLNRSANVMALSLCCDTKIGIREPVEIVGEYCFAYSTWITKIRTGRFLDRGVLPIAPTCRSIR
jgi:hypothetical protein